MTDKNKIRRGKFIRIFLISLAIFSVVAALVTTAYVLVAKNNLLSKVLQTPVLKNEEANTSAKDKAFTVVALFGEDEIGSNQVNTNMLIFFNHKNQEINTVSIPRDTKFNWPEEVYNEISEKRKDIPKIISIHEIANYVNADKRNEIGVQVLENAFHMNIDYYIEMDVPAFKYLVDLVGPVEYSRSTTKVQTEDLNMNGAKASQTYNGEAAVALVKYSEDYPGGDLNRMEVQQGFFKAFMQQILKPEVKVNMPAILKGIQPYLQTNFDNIADYLVYLDDINMDKIHTQTLPGNQTPDHKYAYDSAKSKSLFENILSSRSTVVDNTKNPDPDTKLDETSSSEEPTEPSDNQTNVIVENVYDAKIMPIGIYNGTNINGLAAKTKVKLEQKGYKVVKTDNYQTKPVEKTIIKVYTKEIGVEFLSIFKGATIQVDQSLKGKPEEIVIILGLTENK